MKDFKYQIGAKVLQSNRDGEYEETTITGRMVINGHNAYTTDLCNKWEHEDFLK